MEEQPTDKGAGLDVREFYNGYDAPAYVANTVHKLVSTVPSKFLRGIDCVVLTNQSGMSRRSRLGKVTSRKRRLPQSSMLGRYHPASPGKRPWIELFVDNIVPGLGRYRWIPLIREACFGLVLFHEIGHHVDATSRPEFREKEDVADDWGKKLMGNFFRKKYWLLMPVRKPLGRLFKLLAKTM
jgi:hypothetical protein